MKYEMPMENVPQRSLEDEMREMAIETSQSIERAERNMASWIAHLEKLDAEKHDDELADNAYHALRNELLMNIHRAAEVLDALRMHERLIAAAGN